MRDEGEVACHFIARQLLLSAIATLVLGLVACKPTNVPTPSSVSSPQVVRRAFSVLTGESSERAEVAVSEQLKRSDRLEELTIVAFLQSKGSPVNWPIVARSADGFSVIVGQCNIQDQEFFQVLGEGDVPALVSRDQVSKQFSEVLVARAKTFISSGVTGVAVSDWWSNAGLVTPHSQHAFAFQLKNQAKEPLIIGDIKSTCGCVVSESAMEQTVLSGDVFVLRGNITFARELGTSKTIAVELKRSSGAVGHLVFSILGNQVASLDVSPPSLDFGMVPYGNVIHRRCVLRETLHDKFEISSVSFDGLPISLSSEVRVSTSGLRSHILDVALDHAQVVNLSLDGKIVVRTTSKLLPIVEIPIRATVEPIAELWPTVVYFGERRIGETVKQSVSIRIRGESGHDIEGITAIADPVGTVEVNRTNESLELVFSPTSVGVIDDVLKVALRVNKRVVRFSIRCTGKVIE